MAKRTDWREFQKPTGLWLELKHAERLLGHMIIRHADRNHPETLEARQKYNAIRAKLNLSGIGSNAPQS